MSSFTDKLTVTQIIITTNPPKHAWVTEREFTYYVGKEDSNDFIVVPKGTKTDFASVPRAFWWLFPPDGIYSQAAVLHDFLYQTHKRPKAVCDAIFYEAMGVLGVNQFTRSVMFWAVSWFGNSSWKRYDNPQN